MHQRARRLWATLFAIALVIAAVALGAELGRVTRVIDGDTIKVRLSRRVEKVRLIGVDTPETVDPRRPIEFFGKEASEFTKRLTLDGEAWLESDPQCSNRDKYGRLLR